MMSTDGMENTVNLVDVDIPVNVANLESEGNVTGSDKPTRTEGSDSVAHVQDSDVSRVADCTNDVILVERVVSNDFILVGKPENDLGTGNGCLIGEVEENVGDTALNGLRPGALSSNETVSENQVTSFSAKLIDEIVIELDRPPKTVKSSYRENHLTRWPNSSDIDDESSSSPDEIYYSSDISSSSSSSSTSSSSENEKTVAADERLKIFRPKPKVQSYLPKTKGEMTIDDLPDIQDLTISLPEEEPLEQIGTVYKLVGKQVLVQALKETRPLDIDSVLFLEGRKPLGQVFDVLGPVPQPFYTVRFNSVEDIANKQIVQGLAVFCAPGRSEVTTYIFTEDLRRQKGSDASWKDNNEPPSQFIDYSDDEEERKAKQKRKAKSREPSQKDVEIIHETKMSHFSPSGSGKEHWFHGRNLQQAHTPFRRPPPSHNNQFRPMRFQAQPPPPVFGHPPTFSRGPPVFYGNNINAWPRSPENMGPMDGRSSFGFRFQGPAPYGGNRPPFISNIHQNQMTGPSRYSMFSPPQDPSYFSHPQERFRPPPLQNPSFAPDFRPNSHFNYSQDWFRPGPCNVPAGLLLPPPPPPPL